MLLVWKGIKKREVTFQTLFIPNLVLTLTSDMWRSSILDRPTESSCVDPQQQGGQVNKIQS